MRKIIFILISLSVLLSANIVIQNVKYEAGISFYGEVGTINIRFEQDNNQDTYKMKVVASSSGLIKKLTRNREDVFISEGIIKDGVYKPNKFIRKIIKDDYLEKIIYTFDYKNKKIIKNSYKEELVKSSEFDISTMGIVTKKRLIKKVNKKNIDFCKNDFISLFLNIRSGNIKNTSPKYIDEKDGDNIKLVSKTFFIIDKKNGKEKYNINIINDGSIFMRELIAKDIAFYGDAYIKKVSSKTVNL